MLVRVPNVLTGEEVASCHELLERAEWIDGRLTAGSQSSEVKRNRQLAEGSDAARDGRALVLAALARSALFFTAALPRKIYPPLFNRYDGDCNAFGNHIDNAVRTFAATGAHVRTDLSATLFLSDPAAYSGGQLVIEDAFGTQSVKLEAGDLILYPASSVHRVEPVTRGTRLAAFFWVESMVREDSQRRLLFDLDLAILRVRESAGESDPVVRLTGCYHNLLRMWATP